MRSQISILRLKTGAPPVIGGGELEMHFAHLDISGGIGGRSFLRRSAAIVIQIRVHCGTPNSRPHGFAGLRLAAAEVIHISLVGRLTHSLSSTRSALNGR